MRLVLNAIWFVCAGLWLAIAWLLVSVGLALTIIGIPFAAQTVKIASFALWPFDRMLVKLPASARGRELSAIGNVVWIILAGWWLALVHAIVGIALVGTIIGSPLGIGMLKMIPVTLAPFGREVVPLDAGAAPAADRVQMPTRWSLRHPSPSM